MALYKFLPTVFTTLPTALSLIGASLLVYLTFLQISRYLNPLRKLPYPPGPPPRDIILGNARDFWTKPLWFTLTDWATTYGDIMHLRAFNQHLIVLTSLDDAVELMERRSNNYSDRVQIPMMQLAGASFVSSFKPYGPAWNTHRRLYQQMFRPSASVEYRPTQIEKVNEMLYSFLDRPEDFMTHVQTLSTSIIMATMYGYKISAKNNLFHELAEQGVAASAAILAYPGASIVNILPFLRFLPPWFPGAHFRRVARTASVLVDRIKEVPYKYVQDNLVAGTASPSLVANLIENCKSEEDHLILKEFAATGYIAGADTTTSSITTFILAMAKFPDIQRRAQEELDRIVGTDRLANYDDKASLPYIQAVFRELRRWRPILPLGLFHAATAEDVFKGYYIPEGTAIVPNIWAMTRDPLKYKDPEEFNPDRFLDENNKLIDEDMNYIFGFGRRICPGRHMASDTVWLAIATILATFDIRAPKDASGKDVPLDVDHTPSLVSHPRPFECIITPRSVKAQQLIMDIRNGNNI